MPCKRKTAKVEQQKLKLENEPATTHLIDPIPIKTELRDPETVVQLRSYESFRDSRKIWENY